MASTYSSSLKLQLMSTGENSTTWGSVTNTNLGTTLEEAIVGSADVTFSSGNETLTLTNTNSTQVARNLRLNLTGTTGGVTRTLFVPDVEKVYIISNACADNIIVKNSTGTSVTVPAGKTMWVYSEGDNVVDVTTHLTTLTVGATPSNVVTESATQTLTNKTLTAAQLGSSTATTQPSNDDSTKVATTAMVQDAIRQVGYITSTQLANDSVGFNQIAANSVSTSELSQYAVTAAQLSSNAVTTNKIADDAVTASKIADDAVGSAQIASSVALGGNPTTTTQTVSNRSTRIATTDFVRDAIEEYADTTLLSGAVQASASTDSITVQYGPSGKALILAAAGRKADYGNHGGTTYKLKRGSTTVRIEYGQVIEYDNRDSDSTFVFFYTQIGKTPLSTETWTVESSGGGSGTYATLAYIGF